MKIQFVCLLLLSTTVLSLDLELNPYKRFKNEHVNEDMSVDGCDDVIRERNISLNRKLCKPKNTFIQANIETVKSVCKGEGEPYRGQTISTAHFDIVVCKLKIQKPKYPKCHYNGKALNRRIIIKCVKGFPVYYGGDIDYFVN